MTNPAPRAPAAAQPATPASAQHPAAAQLPKLNPKPFLIGGVVLGIIVLGALLWGIFKQPPTAAQTASAPAQSVAPAAAQPAAPAAQAPVTAPASAPAQATAQPADPNCAPPSDKVKTTCSVNSKGREGINFGVQAGLYPCFDKPTGPNQEVDRQWWDSKASPPGYVEWGDTPPADPLYDVAFYGNRGDTMVSITYWLSHDPTTCPDLPARQ